MGQLYAVCREDDALIIRHVQLSHQLLNLLEGVFNDMELSFLNGIESTLPFTGDWKPDDDELLVLNELPEAQLMVDAASQNAIALPILDPQNFGNQSVKALFFSTGDDLQRRLLLQNFSPAQSFSGNLAFLHDGNVFRRLTEPAFSLGKHLVAIVDVNGDVRFKSYSMLRRIFDITEQFQEATEAQLTAFCEHASLEIENAAAFVASADEILRKSIHKLTQENILEQHTVESIAEKAANTGFGLVVNNGRIVMPTDRKNAKYLLSFLLNKVYAGPINQQLLITNSNRPLN